MRENHERLNGAAMHAPRSEHAARSRTGLLVGITAGLAALAWMSARPAMRQTRRRADHEQERRNPLHFFLAGASRRRHIDRSGARPLFERRQSVYDSY